jgi:CRP-like cAMP-binding protein
MNMTNLDALKKFVFAIHPLTDTEWEAFALGWQEVHYKRKTLLTATGEIERRLYFVLEGVQRAFFLGHDKQEATIVFTYPHSFSGVADSFLLQQPSNYFLETITSSHLLETNFQHVQQLMDKFHNIERLIRKATSIALMGALQRQIELTCFSAEEKFTTLLKRSPHVLNIIPHKYLASYLGIDASTFSKLLATVRI